MQTGEIETLPHEQRLALSYAPHNARDQILTLLLFDARLGDVVKSAREPLLAQMRLAWWRDRLADDPRNWPAGEPLLARLAQLGGAACGLGPMVDAWEMLLGDDQLTSADACTFASGRAAGWSVLADLHQADRALAERAATDWAMVDLSCHLSSPEEQDTVSAAIRSRSFEPAALPKALRPLAVLHALSRRSVDRNAGLLDGPGALAVAMRVGIFGR